jgi:hypothetical protein
MTTHDPALDDLNDLLTRIGEVQATPTANTLLRRLKNLEDSISGATPGGTNIIGNVGGITPRVTATYTRAADATGAYADGDAISNTTTGANVTPITFSNVARGVANGYSGKVTGVRSVIQCGSGSLVTTNLDFDLLIFRAAANIPFAAGSYIADNAALAITAAAMKHLVGMLRFSSSAWEAMGATDAAYQAQSFVSRPYAPFNLADIPATSLIGVMRARAAWNPGNVAQTFDFALDIDQD